jgi:protein arginine kinase activator
MKCEICGLRDAVIHIRQVQKSHSQELHICEECAQEKGLLREEESELSISNLLSGLIEGKEAAGGGETPEACPRCGTRAAEFRKRGRLGCAECFSTFQRDVRSMLSQMAGRTHHTGKVPRRDASASPAAPAREAIAGELRDALDREDYETAAVLRDRLRGLEADV